VWSVRFIHFWCSSRSNVNEEHLMGSSMSVCLSVAFFLETRQPAWLLQGTRQTQGCTPKIPPPQTGGFHPRKCSSGAPSPSGLCPPQPALLWGFAHRAWTPWLCPPTPCLRLVGKPLGFCHLKLDRNGIGRTGTVAEGLGQPDSFRGHAPWGHPQLMIPLACSQPGF
jgi:hypothetical protein